MANNLYEVSSHLIKNIPASFCLHHLSDHSTKPELRLCAGSNPALGASEIQDSEDL